MNKVNELRISHFIGCTDTLKNIFKQIEVLEYTIQGLLFATKMQKTSLFNSSNAVLMSIRDYKSSTNITRMREQQIVRMMEERANALNSNISSIPVVRKRVNHDNIV